MVEGPDRCGTLGKRSFKYEVKIAMPEAALDSQGFLIEHSRIQHYFDNRYASKRMFESCERMAINAIRDIRKTLPDAVKVSVQIWGGPVASILAEWGKK